MQVDVSQLKSGVDLSGPVPGVMTREIGAEYVKPIRLTGYSAVSDR